jgi:MEMO1 family protein
MCALSVRPAAVAGSFYPGDAGTLGANVYALLEHAPVQHIAAKALIVPHAGYVFSGPIAASAYASLRPSAALIRRVLIFGPAHRVWVRGLAATSADFFATPMGRVPVDREAVAAALRLPQVEVNDEAHEPEHSLEVQLPFLQALLDDFSIVPFVVGGATAEQVAEVMDGLWGGGETLIIVSSDLSHYLPYAEAHRMDQASAACMLQRQPLGQRDQACGATPINGLLQIAQRRNLVPRLLDLRNSGDTAGDKSRVVGYAAVAFAEPDHA